MKTENKLNYIVIMYLLLILCAIVISFHSIIYGMQSVQEIQDSQLATVNNECNNSGDGDNDSFIQTIISNIFNRITSNNKLDLLLYIAGTFSLIILFIQISESYFIEQDYLSEIYKRSLIAQKIRLNN